MLDAPLCREFRPETDGSSEIIQIKAKMKVGWKSLNSQRQAKTFDYVRKCLNPGFARIVRVAEQKMKKLIFGAMNRAEIRTSLHSKVLRRGWQGSGYLISLRVRRSASEK